LNEAEEGFVVRVLEESSTTPTVEEVQIEVEKFVENRRQQWIEEKDEQALKYEAKFRSNDCPGVAWCKSFLTRNFSLDSSAKVKYKIWFF
jgi:hypothetical protein